MSIPLFRLFLFVWVWRFVIWSVFLFHLLRRRVLVPAPLHPDELAGLRVLARAQGAFSVVVAAISAVIAAELAERAARAGVPALNFKMHIAAFVVLLPAIVLLPLIGFTPTLLRARFRWLLAYGVKAADYAHYYERRIQPDTERLDEEVSTHCDLGTSFTIVRTAQVVLVDRGALILLTVAAAAPMAILLLSELPTSEIFALIEHVVM